LFYKKNLKKNQSISHTHQQQQQPQQHQIDQAQNNSYASQWAADEIWYDSLWSKCQ
jgi:hypothetical protein